MWVIEDLVVKLHDLKESYAKKKELKMKINGLLSENARLVQAIRDWEKKMNLNFNSKRLFVSFSATRDMKSKANKTVGEIPSRKWRLWL